MSKTAEKSTLGLLSTHFVQLSSRKSTYPFSYTPEVVVVVVDDAKKLFTIGREQSHKFIDSRFIKGAADIIQTPISKNSLKLPRDSKVVADLISP